MSKKAILSGASGFVGSHLLTELLESPDYGEVIAVVRRPLDLQHPKLRTLIGDFATLPSLESALVADEIFIALGTTKKHTPDSRDYYRIDHDYPLAAAQAAKRNGARSLFLVTAVGANAQSIFSYVRTKGELERDVTALGFKRLHLFQPSIIVGERREKRAREKSLIAFWSAINPFLFGRLNKYRGIDGREIARAMVRAAKLQTEETKSYRWAEMVVLARAPRTQVSTR